jgi:hypothetical protein
MLVFTVAESAQGRDLNGDGDLRDGVRHVHHLDNGGTRNLGLTGYAWPLGSGWMGISVNESEQGEDVNLDGDRLDDVALVIDLARVRRLPPLPRFAHPWLVHQSHLALTVTESDREIDPIGLDLNGDGDSSLEDRVLFIQNLDTGALTNLRLASGGILHADEERLYFQVSEWGQIRDFNGDGDQLDFISHVYSFGDSSVRAVLGESWMQFTGRWLLLYRGIDFVARDLQTNSDLLLSRGGSASGYIRGDRAVFAVREAAVDLNGDGDRLDYALHFADLETRTVTNLQFAANERELEIGREGRPFVDSRALAFSVFEGGQGNRDLNGDGDADDDVLHVRDLAGGTVTNLGLTVIPNTVIVSSGKVVFGADEPRQGQDLNGDGDASDVVLHVAAIASAAPDCDGDGIDDSTEIAGGSSTDCNGNSFPDDCDVARGTSEDADVDGVPDECGGLQSPGDCNQDGKLDISDATCTLGVLFLGVPESFPCGGGATDDPANEALLDWQPDLVIDLSDAVAALTYLFSGGPAHALALEEDACVRIAGCQSRCQR